MSSSPTSSAAPSAATSPATPAVAAVILAGPSIDPAGTLQALRAQVHAPAQTLIVGRAAAEGAVVRSSAEVIAALATDISLVWWIHGDTRPRPDALGGLVRELIRTDAAVAGSKVLIDDGTDRLESVGGATDVYGDVYTGLDLDELDLEQYDVVREVSYVSAVSLLVRRDVLRGLGGFDRALPPQAASLDFCQRVRLAGGKVVVVPSSEVFHHSPCAATAPAWKEQGGRNKAMLVAYSLLTLAWVVPMGALVGLADGLAQLALARVRPLLSTLASWLWALVQVPSVIAARNRLRRIRAVSDEELFRFQVSGSSRLRRTFSELSERFNAAIDENEAGSLADRAKLAWRRPSAGLSIVSAIAVMIGTRSIWFSGPPEVGFALPPSGLSGLVASYGGGPNPAGFGSDVVVPPIVGLGSVAYLLLGQRPNLGSALLLLGTIALALLGIARLVRRMGAGSLAGFVAGWVYLGGAALVGVSSTGNWPALLAAGPLPWAIEAVVAPAAEGRRRVGRLASAGLGAGFAAVAYPPVLVVVAFSGLVWALVARRFGAAGLGLAATALGSLLILPYVLGGDLNHLLQAGLHPTIANEWLWLLGIGLGTALVAVFSSRTRLASIWWAGIMVSAGFLVSQSSTLAPGIVTVGLLAAALGASVLSANLVELEMPRVRLIGGATVAVLLFPAVLTVAQGRMGLPPDQWTDRLDFVRTLSTGDPTRALLIGPPGSLPGAARNLSGFDYRTIHGGQATLTQAFLAKPGALDLELRRVIDDHLLAGVDLRPGAALARFGIEWLVIVPGSVFPTEILERQVDLAARPIDTDLVVYQNLAYSAVSDPTQQGSASEIARRAGWGSGVLLVVLVAVAFWGRNRRRLPVPTEPTPEPVGIASE